MWGRQKVHHPGTSFPSPPHLPNLSATDPFSLPITLSLQKYSINGTELGDWLMHSSSFSGALSSCWHIGSWSLFMPSQRSCLPMPTPASIRDAPFPTHEASLKSFPAERVFKKYSVLDFFPPSSCFLFLGAKNKQTNKQKKPNNNHVNSGGTTDLTPLSLYFSAFPSLKGCHRIIYHFVLCFVST